MRIFFVSLILLLGAGSAVAQQRPLLTEDPETIGAGRVLVEGGVEYDDDAVYPVSGLRGNLWRLPLVGVSIGVSSIAEVQIDGVIAMTAARLGMHGDPGDRFIVATALTHGATLMTADERIRSMKAVRTIDPTR